MLLLHYRFITRERDVNSLMFMQGGKMETRPFSALSAASQLWGKTPESWRALLPQENSQFTRAHQQNNTHHWFMAINIGGWDEASMFPLTFTLASAINDKTWFHISGHFIQPVHACKCPSPQQKWSMEIQALNTLNFLYGCQSSVNSSSY